MTIKTGAMIAILIGLGACMATEERSVAVEADGDMPSPVASTPLAPKVPKDKLITSDGLGPLRIGMTQFEVDAAWGPPSSADEATFEECLFYRPSRAPENVLVMMEGDRLTRITLMRTGDYKTRDGVGLGDDIEALKARYADTANWMPHVYVDAPAGYLIQWTDKLRQGAEYVDDPQARGIVYEADETGRVAFIHLGTRSIQYVEGCS